MNKISLRKIVSGGQTGVDRAALDTAICNKIQHSGWCPKGRKAEDGIIPSRYFLQETPTEEYEERTKLNVRDSDGTLILVKGEPMGGTLLTVNEAKRLNKPLLIFNIDDDVSSIKKISQWMGEYKINELNIAGPRESQTNGIYEVSKIILASLLDSLKYDKV